MADESIRPANEMHRFELQREAAQERYQAEKAVRKPTVNIINPHLSASGITQADIDAAKEKLHQLEREAERFRARSCTTVIPATDAEDQQELEAIFDACQVQWEWVAEETKDQLTYDPTKPAPVKMVRQGYRISTDDFQRLKSQEVL